MSATYSTRAHDRKRVPQVRAVGMCQHHTAPVLHARERVPQYELLSCFCIIHHQDCMRAQVRAVDMRRHHTAPGPCTRNEVRKSELLACVSIIQLQACMRAQVRRQSYLRSKRVSQVRAVDMRQHHTAPGCRVIDEYRKYEMSACVRIIQHEEASMSASTSCRHVSASCIVRAA